MIPAPEFSRPVDATRFGGRPIALEANAAERAALARRFGLISIDRLSSTVELSPEGSAVAANGVLRASIVQSCAVSGEPLPVEIAEPFTLRFVPQREAARETDEEIELTEEELDEIPFAGKSFDLGEALAQTLALAVDPYATGPQADDIRAGGVIGDAAASGPFAALAKLRK